MKYLFLDTVVFLHFKGFEDIPWQKLLGTTDDITIVMSSVVLSEIDKHKDGPKGRLKNKARKISEKMREVFLKHGSCRVPLVMAPELIPSDEDKQQYDISVNDNRLLLNALHSGWPKEDVYIVSHDTNILVKAQNAGISYLYLDDEYLASEEPSQEEKELKAVKEELDRIKNRQPEPIVAFEDSDNDVLHFDLIKHRDIDEVVEERVNAEAVRIPEEKEEQITFENSYDYMFQQAGLFPQKTLHTAAEVAVYNAMRKEYLEAFRKKQEVLVRHEMRERAFKRLDLFVGNGGTAMTGQLFVEIVFPEKVRLYSPGYSKSEVEYEKPVTPQYDRALANIASFSLPSIYQQRKDNVVDMWQPNLYLRKSIFTYRMEPIIHTLTVPINEELYINTAVACEFEIRWTIADSALIDHSKGVLKVIVS